mmetsp:Transcript_68789/g.165098  ORF Transcript_68789/g.165098 Transcript_68789/m.165098 type:complete len:121 (+) Transcript_68789:113-475(+)|eukprot:CAMPEP_0178391760 /NCGR_PEP_ID=MMETSP0689_2-20121128/11330_1 /TAXON_ID=160604 /ORGANISM="Amphidinium massartii, Strain CS-259" /LENGTH=120 /DNA_ID=CAMNT_0020012315 /DNA_START=33 /DNA_END=395 /DNA_ORIENTATION=+
MAGEESKVKYTIQNPPPGVVQIVEDTPVTPDVANGIADCVRHPLVAQFTYDALSMLIEACRREREKNYEAIARFPEKGPPFVNTPAEEPQTRTAAASTQHRGEAARYSHMQGFMQGDAEA